jgi:flagellin
MLVRVKELYVQDANGIYNTGDKANITAEITALNAEITNITTNTKFNDITLLNGSLNVNIQISDKTGGTLNITQGAITVTASDLATTEAAISNVSTARSGLGALQNRLEHTVNNINTTAENLQASESRIRDVDMAKEMMSFTKQNILQQAAQSMLAQANQAPQGVLQLLR